MNSKQQKIMHAIFSKPTRAGLKWKDIESLLIHVGCQIKEGNGSRVRFEFGHKSATFHRPHPSPDTTKTAVNEVRKFLIEIGVRNDS